MDAHAAPGGFGVDEVELVAGAVHQDDPGAGVQGVAGFGLVEGGSHDVGGVLREGGGQPFPARLGSRARDTLSGAAAGRGDHIVRAAHRWCRVVDHGDGGHAFAVRLLAAGQAGAEGVPGLLGGLAGVLAQVLGPHHDPFPVHGEHQQHPGGRGFGQAGGVERGGVHGGGPDQGFELAFPADLAAGAGDGLQGLVEGAAHRLDDGQFAQARAAALPG